MRARQLLVAASLFAAALAVGNNYSGTPRSAHAQDASQTATDKFATTVLQGGCSIRLPGTNQTITTAGSGGACPTTVKAMVDHLTKLNPSGMRVFVVSEDEDHPSRPKGYRFVVSFNGTSGTQDGDIFLSVLGGPEDLGEGSLEAMGFDPEKKAYVYYRITGGRWQREGSGAMVPLDSLPGRGEVTMGCQNCHRTGAPLMKELHDSWANWHSTWDAFKKPAASDPMFDIFFSRKAIADDLEPIIISATKAAAEGRVDRAVAAKQTGLMLKQAMCDVGEPNLIAVHQKSKFRFGTIATPSDMLPGAILLSQIFAAPATGTGPEKGLEGNLQMTLPDVQNVRSNIAAYVAAAKKLGISFEPLAGLNDAKFAWLSPEKSHADLAVTMELLARNLIDKDVLADAMMIDFTTPMFSKARCDLASTIPANFADPEELRTTWIANLSNSNLRGAAGLKSRLENKDDFADHEKTINAYLKACATRSSDAADKFNEDVLTIVAQRRNEFRIHFEPVVESKLLLPTDNGSAETNPGTWRLSAATCELEKQTATFLGE